MVTGNHRSKRSRGLAGFSFRLKFNSANGLHALSTINTIILPTLQDGWQVFIPILDNGHQTDILISDETNYHRVQVKPVDASGEDHEIENKWKESNVDVVVVSVRNTNWGYVMPAFSENKTFLIKRISNQ